MARSIFGLLTLLAASAAYAQVTVKSQGGSDTTIPLDAISGQEVIVTQAEFEPGQVIKAHRHVGVEMIYGIAGETEVQLEDQRKRTVKAGETIAIPAGAYHRAQAGPKGAKVLIVRVHATGTPLRIAPDRPVRFPE